MFTFHPLTVGARTPGQVPRLDSVIDETQELAPHYTHAAGRSAPGPQRPVLRASMVAGDLGLPGHIEQTITGLVKTLMTSSHEVEFRRGVMSHLLEQRYDAPLRRAIMNRALSFFRSSRPSTSTALPTLTLRPERAPAPAPEPEAMERSARGGKYHRRVPVKKRGKTVGYKYVYDEASYRKLPDAHVDGESARADYLRGAVRKVLDKAPTAELDHFHDLVRRHGAKPVSAALHAEGARHHEGHVCRGACAVTKSGASKMRLVVPAGTGELAKSDPESTEALPASGGPKPGNAPSPKKLPPGTRRIWHNRVVERGVDDKWHVVGHIAGLETPGAVPPLQPGEIEPGHLKELIAKIKELLQHEKAKAATINAPIPGPPPAAPAPSAKPKTEPKTAAPASKTAAAPKPKLVAK